MLSELRPAAILVGAFTIVLGILYPLAMTGIAGAVMPSQASGSLVMRDGQAIGSSLVGQAFASERYFHPRPSAAGTGYDGASSSGTNLGPTSAKLADRLKADSEALKAAGATVIPADAITTSGSGLDPDISPENAALQVARVAQARGLTPEVVSNLVAQNTAGRTLGILGDPRVNVLILNLALDAEPGQTTPATPQVPAAPVAEGSAPAPQG